MADEPMEFYEAGAPLRPDDRAAPLMKNSLYKFEFVSSSYKFAAKP